MSFLIIANWKMNGNYNLLFKFTEQLNHHLTHAKISSHIVICPPFTAFAELSMLNNSTSLGGQNCFYEKSGAYTGEISAEMLCDCGCRYVIVGHSERRQLFNETNSDIKLKAQSAIAAGLIPIICIGEALVDRESNKFKDVLRNQCEESLPHSGHFIIAYEPVWAIGKNTLPNVDLINEAISIIKLYSDNIVYGGSVSHHSIDNVMQIKGISGVLVGGASIDFNNFYDIILNVEKYQVIQYDN